MTPPRTGSSGRVRPASSTPFVEAGQELVRLGADGLTTSCGFLALQQAELTRACRVPVATSSLMQVALVEALLPPGKTGRHPHHLEGLAHRGAPRPRRRAPRRPGRGHRRRKGVHPRHPRTTSSSSTSSLARQDVVDGARRLVEDHPEVGALVLECTNMCPYSADVAEAVGLPVYDFVSFVTWFQSGLKPRRF